MTTEKFGRYEIIEELGRGGMAVVYLGQDPYMKRQVAVKVLARKLSQNPEFKQRFQHEAEIIASLEHPAIVPVYDFGEHEGQLFIVMRHMPGGTLKERLAFGPLKLQEIAPIIEHVAAALDEAHTKGIVHRDIKPANILFNRRGEALLSDFGIAKMVDRPMGLTQDSFVGTAEFMCPEQILGEEVDGRSDIYALGIVLYRALTGQLPFQKESVIATAMAHLNDPVPSVKDKVSNPRIPWDDILARALAKDPDDRYKTAGALAHDVTGLLSGRWYLSKLLD